MQKIFYSYRNKNKMDRKFGSHRVLYGKGLQRYPCSAEREYLRLVDQYMASTLKILQDELPKVREEYERQIGQPDGMREDGILDFTAFLHDFFTGFSNRLENMGVVQTIVTALYKIGSITKKTEIREWAKMVRKTLGVDLSTDYYNGQFFEQEMNEWVEQNVDLIKTIDRNMLGQMEDVIHKGYEQGKTTDQITEDIMRRYNVSQSRARFIARDQISKLNAKITRKEHEDAGVTRYMWSDSGDKRVRHQHAQLNGHIFEYANPPIMETGAGACNPGEDYNCRCVAIPVFEKDRIELPLTDGDDNE